MTLIIAGMRWWAGRGREYRWREARGSGGEVPARGSNELKIFHKQIFSRNEA